MASHRKFSDLKYEEEKISVKDIVEIESLPIVVRTCSVACQMVQANLPEDTDILLQCVSKETCAHIKVLQFYDNKKMQQENGCEYVLEHETFVGNKYLIPLSFPGKVKFVRRPGSRERYLEIKQVLDEFPAFVKAENETRAFLSSDMQQEVMIGANTILELKRKHNTAKGVLLECTDGDRLYIFHENDEVNFTVFEKQTLYSLELLPGTLLLPQVILFDRINAEDAVLKDQSLRSALLTMVEGPLELLGFRTVDCLIGWIRNKAHRTYETILVPKQLWSEIFVRKLCFYSDKDREECIERKYGPCLMSDFVRNSLFLLPPDLNEITWLRSPDLFKSNVTENKLYEVRQVTFLDSSDDEECEHIYADIEEPPPPIPKRRPIQSGTKPKRNMSFSFKVRALIGKARDKIGQMQAAVTEQLPARPPKPNFIVHDEAEIHNDLMTGFEGMPNSDCRQTRPLPFPSEDTIRKEYTKLQFHQPLTVYSSVIQNNITNPDKSHAVVDAANVLKQELKSNQSREDFFSYSVKEVSLCFENCGLKHLAETCTEQRLDGSFFRGFDDWNVLNVSGTDIDVVKKVIYEKRKSRNEIIS